MINVNRIIFAVATILTLIFWIGGILLVGEIRYTLPDPSVVGWGGIYLNLFFYLSLPICTAVAAYDMMFDYEVTLRKPCPLIYHQLSSVFC